MDMGILKGLFGVIFVTIGISLIYGFGDGKGIGLILIFSAFMQLFGPTVDK